MFRNAIRLIGLAAIVCGLVLLGIIPYFYWRSHTVGSRLLKTANQSIASVSSSSLASEPVAQTQKTVDGLIGVLQIPKLGLSAPVVEGTGDSSLNVAVGHLSTSAMPGAVGTSLLAAHNASWFRHINQLEPGDEIEFTTKRGRYVFTVTNKQIVHVGTPLKNTAGPSLDLESCYPLDALYLTPYRYVVSAALKAQPTGGLVDLKSLEFTSGSRYIIDIPACIRREGVTLATNSLPMGTLTYTGNPSNSYVQSNAPLQASSDVVQLYLALLHALADKDNTAVQQLLSGLADRTNPLWGTPVNELRYRQGFDIQLAVEGTQLLSVSALTDVTDGQHVFTVRMTVSAAGSQLRITQFELNQGQ